MSQNNRVNSFPKFSKKAWRYYAGFFSGQYGKIFWTTFASVGQTLIIIPSLLLVKHAFDVVIPDHDISLLIWIGIAIFLLRLMNSVLSVILRKYHIRIINQAVFDLRESLLKKLYGFSYLFYAKSDLRILHTRIVQDTERLCNMSTALISRLLPSVIIGLGLLIACFILNWYLLLIIVSLFPILIFANRFMGEKIKRRVFVFQRAFEEFSKGIYFVLRYMPLTTIQSAQKEEMAHQKGVLVDLQQKTSRMADIFAVNLQLQEILTGLTAIVIIIIGGISVAVKSMTLGDFLSFYLAAMYLNKYVNMITTSIPDIIAGNVSLNTLFELFSIHKGSLYTGAKTIDFDGEITMKGISFAYDDNLVLKGMEFQIRPGERVAIVGANGSGKTTILNLICGLLVPLRGEIKASGCHYPVLDMVEFRKHLGVVAQHPPLFPGSILENIVYGAEKVDMDQLRHVASLALADDFVAKLPEGYNTPIGDEGVLLSGGEGQRIAIARALYRNPKLLILDEPGNHLDSNAIGKIMDNLGSIQPLPAILIISHERNVINFAEKIYHLNDGVLTACE